MIILTLLACQRAEPAPDEATTLITWDAPITLEADYEVPQGTTLTIEPGVTVTLAEGVALLVEGELVARGTEDAPVTFTGDAAAPWGGVVFAAGAVDARFDGFDTYAGGSIVEHAVVENATRGMELAGASPYLRAVTFQYNVIPPTVDTIGGAALLVSGAATPRVRDCRFEGNVASSFAFGGAIYVDAADPILQDNVFLDNEATYGGAVSTELMASPIVGSTFEGNESQSEGGGVSLVSTVSALLANTFTGNYAEKDGGGIHVCVTCDPHAAPYLLDNVVTGNESGAADPDEGAAGVGAAFLGALTSNDVHDNLRAGEPSDFGWFHLVSEGWPDWVSAPDLGDNWWGTEDRDAIDAAVWDGADSDRYGAVTLEPVRTGPVAAPIPRVVISSRRTHYADAGEAVPVFLTLYNPGLERTLLLSIERDGEPFDGALEVPGTTADGTGWEVVMPENTVWFGKIDEDTYDGSAVDDITWEATLSDAATGELIGVPSVARYLYGPEGS